MELNKQVCSLELSKKLKELGVKQESLFYHVKVNNKWKLDFHYQDYPDELPKPTEEYSAFTPAELGEILPKVIIKDKKKFVLKTCPEVQFGEKLKWDSKGFWCGYYMIDKPEHLKDRFNLTEANARARMLIYLIENNLIKNKL